MSGVLKDNRGFYGVGIIILLVSIFIRVNGLADYGLHYDELQSVTHAYNSPLDIWESVSYADPHPPLYYVTLGSWMSIFGTSDYALRLNGVFWSLLTSIILFFATEQIINRRVAILAILLFALMPVAQVYAQQVRMYSMLMFLNVAGWWAIHVFLNRRRPIFAGLAIIVITFVSFYSHGTGIFVPLGMSVYTSFWLLGNLSGIRERLRRFAIWFMVQLIGVLTFVPWYLSLNGVPTLGHLSVPSWHDVFPMIYHIALWFYEEELVVNWVAVLLIVIQLPLLFKESNRYIILAFLIVPFVFGGVISHLYRPIWSLRTFSLMVPFLALSLALLTDEIFRLFERSRRVSYLSPIGLVIVVIGGVLGLLSINHFQSSRSPSFLRAADIIKDVPNSSVVLVSTRRVFWGLAWYVSGPGNISASDSQENYNINIMHGSQMTLFDSYVPSDDMREYWLVNLSYLSKQPPDLPTDMVLIEDWNFSGIIIKRYVRNEEDILP